MSTYMPLLLVQEKVNQAFEAGKVVCGLYLDLRKAFDTVNQTILLKKLYAYGIRGNALMMLESYLEGRTQCVEVEHVRSSLASVDIGVPQGSILGPLLFLIYINDFPSISDDLTAYLYADDTAIFIEGNDEAHLQRVIDATMPEIVAWLQANQLSLNTDKTFCQLYNNTKRDVNVSVMLSGAHIKFVKTVKYLGMYVDDDLKWKSHISHLSTTLTRNVGLISRARYILVPKQLLLLYNALFLPYINYCCMLYSNTYITNVDKLEKLQKRAVRMIDGEHRLAHTAPIFKKLKILKLRDIGKQQMLLLMHRKLKGTLPSSIDRLFTILEPLRDTRSTHHFHEFFSEKFYRSYTTRWSAPRIWNSIIAPKFTDMEAVPLTKREIKDFSKQFFIDQY